jgi:phosphopantothenoylcysteine decarboxylase/phosphopantothenate--cysteine ligase
MRVALGVSGGVAAYKAAELVRKLQQDGMEVQVIMTDSAQEFITPLTFAALTGQKVITEMFGAESDGGANVESAIEHIAVAQRIDLLVIAPATANTIAKMARGIADDFLTTLYLATTAPVVVAPAMNVSMWEHAATQENVETLRARGVHIVPPEEGYLACGMIGAGRLASVDAIASAVLSRLGVSHDLQEETIIVTAGPTCEDLDPVRFLSNRSSGKMGYALATAAARRGANVILISGPTRLDPPQGVQFVSVRNTEQMHRAVLDNFTRATSLIMAAAVADYRPVTPQTKKMKRGNGRLSLELEPTVDILSDVARGKANRVIVGFAAETENVAAQARAKLESKDADMIVANDVTAEGAGFDHDTNIITLYFRDGSEKAFERTPKIDAAHRILDQLRGLRKSAGHSLEQPAETQRTR